jgi:hypothetical protein
MQMAKTSAKESEATGYLRATIKALRREKREVRNRRCTMGEFHHQGDDAKKHYY